jgi:hypothetical protein
MPEPRKVCGGLINRLLFSDFEPGDPARGKLGLSDGPIDRAGFCLPSGAGCHASGQLKKLSHSRLRRLDLPTPVGGGFFGYVFSCCKNCREKHYGDGKRVAHGIIA